MVDREEYVNFENALKELKLSEDQLKRLVSEGEIRAIRGENNSMKFRREEIERLKQDTGKTMQYTEESSDTLTDDLLFDEASDLEVEDEGMATAQISSEDTFVGEETGTGAPPPAAGRGAAARPRAGAREVVPAKAGAAARGTTQTVRRTTGRSTRIRQTAAMQMATGIGMGVTVMLIVSFILSAYALLVWWDIANNQVSSATRGVADWAGDTFGNIKGQ